MTIVLQTSLLAQRDREKENQIRTESSLPQINNVYVATVYSRRRESKMD